MGHNGKGPGYNSIGGIAESDAVGDSARGAETDSPIAVLARGAVLNCRRVEEANSNADIIVGYAIPDCTAIPGDDATRLVP
jgi:hypothetical protein